MSPSRKLENTDVTPIESLHGVGVFMVGGREIVRASFRLSRERFRSGAYWTLTAYGDDLHSHSKELCGVGRPKLEFSGETETGRRVHIDPMLPRSIRKHQLEAEATSVFLGAEVLASVPERHRVYVELTPTPFAHPQIEWLSTSFTGEIIALPSEREKRAATAIPLEVGRARLVLRYHFEDAAVSGITALLRIPTATVEIVVDRAHRTTDVRELLRTVGEEIEDTLRVLSLLSRRHVRWSRIRHAAHCVRVAGYEEGEWSRVVSSSPNDARRSPLLNAYRLPPEGIRRLVTAFRTLTYRAAAGAAITYLVAAHDATVIETKLVQSFTAFEALITGIDSASDGWRTVPRSQYDRLRGSLSQELESFAAKVGMAAERLAEMKEKLGEVQRRPVVERAIELLEANDVAWADLWPVGVDLRAALKAAYRRRNAFIHSGSLPSALQAKVDAERIRTLAERLLLRQLGADPDWHDHFSFEGARDLSSDHLARELGAL